METLVIVLEGERAPSWNSVYSGMHWTKRAELARTIKWKVREALNPDVSLLDEPVDITIRAHYKKNPPDSDNIMDKMYIDALKDRVLRDDDGRWVRRTMTEAIHSEEEKVEIIITPIGE